MTRSILGAAKGLLFDVLEPMTRTVEDSVEAQNTAEMLRNIRETNESLGNGSTPRMIFHRGIEP